MAAQDWQVYRRGPGDYLVHKGPTLSKVYAERTGPVHFPTKWDAEAVAKRLNERRT